MFRACSIYCPVFVRGRLPLHSLSRLPRYCPWFDKLTIQSLTRNFMLPSLGGFAKLAMNSVMLKRRTEPPLTAK